MKLDYFQIDAFSGRVFGGNPAGVVPLYEWLSDEALQRIASENGQSETAFFVRKPEYYELRWFTPTVEVELCGHATLAAAHVLFEYLGAPDECVVFETKSGRLFVDYEDGLLSMDFPAWEPKPFQVTERVARALGAKPSELYSTRDFLAVYDDPEEVRALKPDFARVAELDGLAVIATAKGQDYDFISRCFAPAAGIPEDPVTGSAHCTLVPFWAKRLGKTKLHAYQASARGGELFCEHLGDRIKMAGQATCYMIGTIILD
ncbi:MAG: PhzF family phenazine biosynthesis protein [Desulfovibrionaceae bacterium]|jgi:PhzF family phenazine biosynthesis protein